MTAEIWKPVVGLEKYYAVSNLGRVKSTIRRVKFGSRSRTIGNRILKPNNNGHDYLQVTTSIDNHHKNMYVHRMVAEAFISNPTNLKEVNHIDGNKANNTVANLEWVSAQQNIDHAIKNGLTPLGSNSVKAKLDRLEARNIKREYLVGIPSDVIAKRHKCSRATVNSIGNEKKYLSDTGDIPKCSNYQRKILKVNYGIGTNGISRKKGKWRAVLTIDKKSYLDKLFYQRRLAVKKQSDAFQRYLVLNGIKLDVATLRKIGFRGDYSAYQNNERGTAAG